MYGWRARVGLLVPANNTVIEPEMSRHVPSGVSAYATRMIVEGPFEPEALLRMEQGALRGIHELVQSEVDVVVYCCLATSLSKGREWDTSMSERYSKGQKFPVFSAGMAVVDAMQHLGIQRPTIVSPYPASIQTLIKPYFASFGFDVVATHNMGIQGYDEVVAVTPGEVYRFVMKASFEGADGIVILATDLRTLEIIEPLEGDCSLPVVSTNQAILWRALRAASVSDGLPGLGALLTV